MEQLTKFSRRTDPGHVPCITRTTRPTTTHGSTLQLFNSRLLLTHCEGGSRTIVGELRTFVNAAARLSLLVNGVQSAALGGRGGRLHDVFILFSYAYRAVRAHFDALVFARRHCSVGGRHDRGRFSTRVWRDLRTRHATRQAAIGQNRRKSAVLARPFLWRPRIAMSTERARNGQSDRAAKKCSR